MATMRISLKLKNPYAEHTTLSFYSAVPEAQLIKALGKLDDGEIEAIEVPNHIMPKELVERHLLPEFYYVEY
jgi:hypothetical protein